MPETDRRQAQRPQALVLAVAGVWACVIGGLMAAAVFLFGADDSDMMLTGVLGGLGAAAAVIVLAGKR